MDTNVNGMDTNVNGMDTNANERTAEIENGAYYYNSTANIQLSDTNCIFHQVNYQGYTSILGSTSRSNVQIGLTGATFKVDFNEGEWGYYNGTSMLKPNMPLNVQGSCDLINSNWIEIGNRRYTRSKREADDNDK